MTVKPSVFDGVNVTSEAQKIQLLEVENLSQKEYCENPEDIKNSEFVLKFILLIEKKVSSILEQLKINNSIASIYKKFINNLPITKIELNSIINFFKNEEINKEIEKFVLKLLFLYWEKNKDFVENYLKNSEWNLSSNKFIEYILWELESYNFVIDIENENSIKLVSKTKEWDYYTYESGWKTWIFIVSNGEIFMLKKMFNQITLLNNWLVFCRIENKNSGITEFGNEWLSGLLYKFNWNEFVLMEKLPWTIDVQNTQKEDLFTTSTNLIWYWLSEISVWDKKQDELWVEVTELLSPVYNSIRFQGNFVIVSRPNRENRDIYEIYVNVDNKLELAHTTESNSTIWLRDLWNNYYLVDDVSWKNIYKLDEHNIFEIVDPRLLNMFHANIEQLMKWEPSLISNNKETWIYVFDKNTWKLTKIIDATNINLNSPEMDWDMMTISTEYWKEIFFYKDWKIYEFSKWYSLHTWYIYWYLKKWFFGEKIFVKNSFDTMAPYLTEIKTPIKLRAK